MLVVRPIAGDQSRYYLEGPGPGRWVGGGSKDLGLTGPVDEKPLRAVLAGHQPGGERLLPTRAARRRDGFDLILAAPKSVSLVAAMGDDKTRELFHRAHDEAVQATIGFLERQALRTRRGTEQRLEETSGFVAAAFQHTLSSAGDPHLHTHVVVANLVQADGKWSSLDSRSLYWDGGAAGAVYQANLRRALDQQGLRFEWTVDRRGLGDIVGVPRAAIEAVSTRHKQVRAEIEEGMAGRLGRATAGPRTRRTGARDREADDPGWQPRVAASGFERPDLDGMVTAAATRHQAPGAALDEPALSTLDRVLSEGHSRIRRRDVVRAAASLFPGGASATELESLTDRFLTTAVDTGHRTWTTATLQRLEQQILSSATPGPPGRAGPGGPTHMAGTAGVAATAALPDHLDQVGREAVTRLTQGGAPVDVLQGHLIAQAQVIEAARGMWEADGHRVAVLSPTPRGQARWQVLAGLERPPPGGRQPTVLVVDNADRWSTTDLHRVVVDATARHAKVVLLDGGTSLRRAHPESPAVEALRSTPAVIQAGRDPPSVTPSPPTTPLPGAGSAVNPLVRAGAEHRVIVTDRTSAAVQQLVSDWHQEHKAGKRPRMVALGPEEAEHLNRVARARLQAAGELNGPSIEVAGRSFQVGDDVLALRRDPRLHVAQGRTVGKVTAVDPGRGQLDVQWSGRDDAVTITVGKAKLPLGHAYATTPAFLRGVEDVPILSWGHVEAVSPRLHPDRVYEVLAPLARPARDPADPLMALVAELRGGVGAGGDRVVEASESLSVLAVERDELAKALRQGAPPRIGTSEMRQLEEERAWLLSVPDRPGGAAALAALDTKTAELNRAATARGDWIETHRAQIQRWDDLSRTIAWRETALGRGAEIRPTEAVRSCVGTPPADPHQRDRWRHVAKDIERYRDRWSVADGKLGVGRPAGPRLDARRQADERRILASARELERGRVRDRERGLTPAGR